MVIARQMENPVQCQHFDFESQRMPEAHRILCSNVGGNRDLTRKPLRAHA